MGGQVLHCIDVDVLENVPLGHDVHREVDCAYCPGGQGIQFVDPSWALIVPGLQSEQFKLAFVGLNVPKGQGRHSILLNAYVPLAHIVHDAPPLNVLTVPFGHGKQEFDMNGAKNPGSHCTQISLFKDGIDPGAQIKHTSDPAGDHIPNGHCWQNVLLVAFKLENVPPGHIVHDVFVFKPVVIEPDKHNEQDPEVILKNSPAGHIIGADGVMGCESIRVNIKDMIKI